jgi:hypothetical protein
LLTKCASGTGIRAERPGSASAFVGMLDDFLDHICNSCIDGHLLRLLPLLYSIGR